MPDKIIVELNSEMETSVDGLAGELASIRSGRATPSLVENVVVDYHGAPVPLRQIATVSTPEFNLIVIQPWERSSLRSIEKDILKANIGFNPSNDGNVVRIAVPPLNEERRAELAKLVSKRVEERRVALRNMRRNTIAELRRMEKNKEISQDELSNAIKHVDEIGESFIDKANEIGKAKEKEIREL